MIGSMNVSKAMNPNVEFQLDDTCYALSQEAFPDLIGRIYYDMTMDKESLSEMEAMIRDLTESFEQMINENTWMDTVTKQEAMNKLKSVVAHIAAPDYSKDEKKLEDFHSVVSLIQWYIIARLPTFH